MSHPRAIDVEGARPSGDARRVTAAALILCALGACRCGDVSPGVDGSALADGGVVSLVDASAGTTGDDGGAFDDAGAGDGGDPPDDDGGGGPDEDGGAGADGGANDGGGAPNDGGSPLVDGGGSIDGGAASTEPRYDEVQQKSAHNAFQRDEALFDMLVYHRVRSIELDIHTTKSGFTTTSGDWFVYHDDNETETTCHMLSDCFDDLAAFDAAVPDHEVVTVFIDLKTSWTADGHQPASFDALARSLDLVEPGDVVDACPPAATLRDALDTCGWPRLDALRGRFLLALTGGNACDGTGKLAQYAGGSDRAAFIAPAIDDVCTVASYDDDLDVGIINMDAARRAQSSIVAARGLVARVYDLNDATSYGEALVDGAHHLGTDKVSFHADPWSATHNAAGWPFTCAGCASHAAEAGPIVRMRVDSEDIWDTSDHFAFAHRAADVGDHTWRAAISTPNSHVEPFAKACLMARASTATGARYFAVCRPADANRLRAQWRDAANGTSGTASVDIVPADTIDQESLAYVRLVVTNGAACAEAQGSQDGTSWTTIASRCFDVALDLQGLAASSHGPAAVKLLFAAPTMDGAPVVAGDLAVDEIGTVRSSTVADGAF